MAEDSATFDFQLSTFNKTSNLELS